MFKIALFKSRASFKLRPVFSLNALKSKDKALFTRSKVKASFSPLSVIKYPLFKIGLITFLVLSKSS